MNVELELSLQDLFLVLTFVNIYQPVPSTMAVELLSDLVEEDPEELIDQLVSKGYLREIPEDRLRATWRGIQALGGLHVRKDRDINRMWNLAELTDEGEAASQ